MRHLFEKMKNYRFQIQHLIILFAILLLFQTLLSYINTASTDNLLSKTMELYRKDSAENFADLTATSLELLLEHELSVTRTAESHKVAVREFNIILSQQSLRQNVSNLCVIVNSGNRIFTIDDGNELYDFFLNKETPVDAMDTRYAGAVRYYVSSRNELFKNEQITSFMDESRTFNVLVPFGPMGEIAGAVYMKISPDFTNIANEISSVSGETGAIFSALILLALLANFYMGSYMIKERDMAQSELFDERQLQIKQQVEHEKESLFTRRIYHAHHKAEKIMGFIKTDVRSLTPQNIDSLRNKIIKYANFVSRVIYDMKTYEPPLNVIRDPVFQTDINEVIRFIVGNIFNRNYQRNSGAHFNLALEDNLPPVPVNEYVVWEIIEPLIQNSLDHNADLDITITIRTLFDSRRKQLQIMISDDGRGIDASLLEFDEDGIRHIFHENTTTKKSGQNAGYGCYLAFEISRKWCRWSLDAANGNAGGAQFTITIPQGERK